MKHLINFIQEGLKLGSSKINDNPEKELSSSEIMQKISFKGKAYTEACQKMEAWHKGVRKQNLKNCSNEKLKNNYWICRKMGYTKEADQIKNEANSRGLVLEGLKLGSSKIYTEFPKDWNELRKIIEERLEKDPNADLNDINVSEIENMEALFKNLDHDVKNIKIDKWDVSNVKSMWAMFSFCNNLNADLSKWDVSNVTNMSFMFNDCRNFNSDLSKWNVEKVTDMQSMFTGCFKFDSNLSEWNVKKVKNMSKMFKNTPLENHPPKWFRE